MEVTQERVNLKIEQEKLSNVSRGVEESAVENIGRNNG